MKVSLEEAWPAPSRAHVETAVERLVEAFHPLRIVVFGSYEQGEPHPGSDLDFLVVLSETNNKREAAIAMRRVLSDLPVPHDVYVTTPDEIEQRGWIVGTLLHEGVREGQVVYESSEGV